MYNFAIVGIVAIFYQRGVPTYITQGYLIASSIIVTWQLSYFNDWMAWALLIMLAVYDLFAVLSPCGPLRALVKLMSKDDAPSIPGLLYEARLAENVTRPGRRQQSRQDAIEERNNNERPINDGNEDTDEPPLMLRGGGADSDGDIDDNDTEDNVRNAINNEENGKMTCPTLIQANNAQLENDTSVSLSTSALHVSSPNTNTTPPTTTTIVPLAIARVYKLPIIIASDNTLTGAITSLDTTSPTAYLQQEHQFSAIELQMNVEVILPRNGGWIETTLKNGKLRYVIYNRDGLVKRTLLVNEDDGKVMEVVIPNDVTNNNQTNADYHPSDNTIKLGLGDFIFFSVLVSKASVHGFAAFVACFLSILAGLGGTLILLAVFHHALPALPISIFLAVIMFVLTIYVMEPWIEEGIWSGPYYV
jgi:presenilin 1